MELFGQIRILLYGSQVVDLPSYSRILKDRLRVAFSIVIIALGPGITITVPKRLPIAFTIHKIVSQHLCAVKPIVADRRVPSLAKQ